MLVPNTIELRRPGIGIICLETTLSIRLVGAFLITFPIYLILLTANDTYPSKELMIVSLSLFVIIGIYLFGRFKRLCFDSKQKSVHLWITFLFIPIKSAEISFNELTDFKIEERSHGQTFQQKYRLFLLSKESKIDIGIVNDLKIAESIQKKILNLINTEIN